MSNQPTIAAIATAAGQGGVGIVRVSGEKSVEIAKKITGIYPKPRYAHYGIFSDLQQNPIDSGITLYFKKPHSFTGEDVVEFQAHGGPVVLDIILKQILQCGAQAAKAGEFSERAFLNNKIDLAQAEAIADLISAESEQAARAANRSLQGEFSNKIKQLVEQLIQLRIFIESALDFPEEEIDFLADASLLKKFTTIQQQLKQIKQSAIQGRLLKEGMTIVIAGKPNVGKSSLLNKLAGIDSAIVTNVAGTTRDILREHIQIDGLPLHIIDTAGLRETQDIVEQEGVKRAKKMIKMADHVFYVMDVADNKPIELSHLPKNTQTTLIVNKIDKQKISAKKIQNSSKQKYNTIYLSAKTGDGIDLLKNHIKDSMNYQQKTEGQFIARRRHLEAIEKAENYLNLAQINLTKNKAGELVAEELRLAQDELSSITGNFSSDDLLGRIFSDFCIGK